MNRATRTLTVLSLIGAAAGLLGGVVAMLIHHLAKTTGGTDGA